MPHPNSGRITRSPFAVPRITRIDWRTLSSNSACANPRVAGSSARGKLVPMPRNGVVIVRASAHEHGGYGNDAAHRQVRRIVARLGDVAVSRGRLAVDVHRLTSLFDRPRV